MQNFLPTVQELDDTPNVAKYNVIRILFLAILFFLKNSCVDHFVIN